MSQIHKRRQLVAEINVVPYIDVMLVLLIIFMVTTPLLTEGVKIDLPQADAEPIKSTDNPPLVISIDKNGQFFLAEQGQQGFPLSDEELLTQSRAIILEQPRLNIMVRGDRDIHYGRVIEAMVILKQAGAASVGLITEQKATP